MSARTVESLGAEAREIERTGDTSNVLLGTEWALWTEASVVPLALLPLDGGIYMQIEAVVSAVAESKCSVESAFG